MTWTSNVPEARWVDGSPLCSSAGCEAMATQQAAVACTGCSMPSEQAEVVAQAIADSDSTTATVHALEAALDVNDPEACAALNAARDAAHNASLDLQRRRVRLAMVEAEHDHPRFACPEHTADLEV